MATVMTNRGAVIESANGDVSIAEWRFQTPDHGVVLEVELCGLCGSDVHTYRGESGGSMFPMLLGHEYVARVARATPGVLDVLGRPLREGDRVVAASPTFGECGQCRYCAYLRAPWLCPFRTYQNIEVDGASVRVSGGGFARYLPLTSPRGDMLLRVDVEPRAAALYEPLTIAVQMMLSGPRVLGADVVVQGTGAIGLLTILLARAAGAERIIAIGQPEARLELARTFGADVTVDIGQVTAVGERAEIVTSSTLGGFGAAVCYEIAGTPAAMVEGLSYLQPSGVLMEAGNAANTGDATINPNLDVQSKATTIVGVRGRTLEDFVVAGRLMPRFAGQMSTLVSHELPLTRLRDGIRALGGAYRLDDQTVAKIALDPRV